MTRFVPESILLGDSIPHRFCPFCALRFWMAQVLPAIARSKRSGHFMTEELPFFSKESFSAPLS